MSLAHLISKVTSRLGMTGTCISFSFLHLAGRNEGTNGRRRSLTFPPVGGFAFDSCPPRKVSARFDVILGAAALLFCILPHFPLCYWTAGEIGAVLHHSVMWDCLSWICYHRDVHAADSAQLGGGYIKELSWLFPKSAAGVFALGWWSPAVLLCHLFAAHTWGKNICSLHLHIFCAKLSCPHVTADNFGPGQNQLWVQLGLKLEFHIAFPMAVKIYIFFIIIIIFCEACWKHGTFQSSGLPPSKAVSGTSVSSCKVSALSLL